MVPTGDVPILLHIGPGQTLEDTTKTNGHECKKEISNEGRRVPNELEKKGGGVRNGGKYNHQNVYV